MFATANHPLNHRRDVADTCAFASSSVRRLPAATVTAAALPAAPDALDALEQIDHADAADHALLRLVGCTACATLLLALASSVGGW